MRHNPRLHGLQFFLFLVLGLEVADDGLLASPALAAGFTCLPLLVQVVWSWLSCLLPRTAIPFVDWLFRKTTGCQFLFPWPSPAQRRFSDTELDASRALIGLAPAAEGRGHCGLRWSLARRATASV